MIFFDALSSSVWSQSVSLWVNPIYPMSELCEFVDWVSSQTQWILVLTSSLSSLKDYIHIPRASFWQGNRCPGNWELTGVHYVSVTLVSLSLLENWSNKCGSVVLLDKSCAILHCKAFCVRHRWHRCATECSGSGAPPLQFCGREAEPGVTCPELRYNSSWKDSSVCTVRH